MSTPRLAYLLKKFPRLSETFVLNEILAQERLGHSIHVFSRRAADDEPRHAELARLEAEVEVLPGKRAIDPWRSLFQGPWRAEEMLARIADVVEVAGGWEHPRFSELLGEALWLRTRTEELGIGHVHTHFATDSAVTAMILRLLGGPSYSLTVHAKDIYRSTVRGPVLEQLFKHAEFVVTVCDANVRHLEALVGREGCANLRRLYNGIDLDTFRFVDRSAAAEGVPQVVSVGRLVAKKGFDVLVDALAILRERGTPFRATILGEGEERASLEARIASAGLGDVLELAGALDQDAVRARLAEATVLALPCLVGDDGNRDALPTVLLESLAMGLPAVSTPVTGIPEILDEGRVGPLVPERDARATAEAIAGLLADPGRRADLARAGRRRAEELFDLEKNSRQLHEWLSSALVAEAESCA